MADAPPQDTAPDAAASVIRQARQGTEASFIEIFFCIRRARPRLQIHFSDKIVQDHRMSPRRSGRDGSREMKVPPLASETGRPFPPVCGDEIYRLPAKRRMLSSG